jgi:hypothetical protein
VRQEQIPVPRGHHQVHALACKGLFEEASEASALMVEADLALVGDHRAELGLDRVALQPDLQKRRVLQGEGSARGYFLELVQVRLAHWRIS